LFHFCSILRGNKYYLLLMYLLFSFLATLGSELRTSHLLGRCSYCLSHFASPCLCILKHIFYKDASKAEIIFFNIFAVQPSLHTWLVILNIVFESHFFKLVYLGSYSKAQEMSLHIPFFPDG
jgi:hypothetical protein